MKIKINMVFLSIGIILSAVSNYCEAKRMTAGIERSLLRLFRWCLTLLFLALRTIIGTSAANHFLGDGAIA